MTENAGFLLLLFLYPTLHTTQRGSEKRQRLALARDKPDGRAPPTRARLSCCEAPVAFAGKFKWCFDSWPSDTNENELGRKIRGPPFSELAIYTKSFMTKSQQYADDLFVCFCM